MSTASDMVTRYLAAEIQALEAIEATLGDRSVKMAELKQICAERQKWEARLSAELATAARAPSLGSIRFSVARLDR